MQITSANACNGHQFIPASYENLDKHFHSLKSWAIRLHVARENWLRDSGGNARRDVQHQGLRQQKS